MEDPALRRKPDVLVELNKIRSVFNTSKTHLSKLELNKENMKRSSSMSISSRGRRKAQKKESCCNSCESTTTKTITRRCFSEAESSSNSHSSEDSKNVESSSNTRISSFCTDWSDTESLSCELEDVMEMPPSPTANLKMLFSAVSPEIRKMQSQKLEDQKEVIVTGDASSFDSDLTSSQDSDSLNKSILTHGSRKEKSLGLLCEKFLQQYPSNPPNGKQIEICLDEVAKSLGVERRRIYDIVNVLESVEVMSRRAKNKYTWHGMCNLKTTLSRLKVLAEEAKYPARIERFKQQELKRDLNSECSPVKSPSGEEFNALGDTPLDELKHRGEMRKAKSLGIMSQRFLMLFLASKPQTVNLDMSAKILIGDENLDKLENSKFKTKIRRLYDIANILTSLKLIRKVSVTEFRGRKPAFTYIGPDIDTLDANSATVCYSDGCHRPSTRHSLLDCIRDDSACLLMNNTFRPIRPALPTEGPRGTPPSNDRVCCNTSSHRLPRYSSLEQILAVTEKDRSRLLGCDSEPCSASSNHVADVDHHTSDPGQAKAMDESSDTSSSQSVSVSMPATSTSGRMAQTPATVRVLPRSDTVIIKARSFSGPFSKGVALTKDHIEGILHSVNHPVKNRDASTQSACGRTYVTKKVELASPSGVNLIAVNEHTPVTSTVTTNALPTLNGVSRKRCLIDLAGPGSEKRIMVDVTTPPSPNTYQTVNREKTHIVNDSDVSTKPKPTRALTFLSDGNDMTPEPSVGICPTRPVATRPHNHQQFTVQVANGRAKEFTRSIIRVPVMNVPEKGNKVILANIPPSTAGTPVSQVSEIKTPMQSTPVTCFMATSTQQPLHVYTQSHNPSKARSIVVSASHPTVHIVHPSVHPTHSTAGALTVVPMSFNAPLTPSEEPTPSTTLTFDSFQGLVPQRHLNGTSAFQVVHRATPNSIKFMPPSPMTSPGHVPIINVVENRATSSSQPFDSQVTGTVLAARSVTKQPV